MCGWKMPERAKQKLGWMWISVLVVLALACLVGVTAYPSVRWLPGMHFSAAPIATFTPFHVPTQISTPTGTFTPTVIPSQTPTPLTDIDQAKLSVSQNPSDPLAYLQLARLYWQANQPDLSEQTVTDIEKVAGGDENVCWDAGVNLASASIWLPAARMFVDALEIHNRNGTALPADRQDQAYQAVYQAFKDQAAPKYITIERLAKVDKALSAIANSLYTLYYGDQAAAQILLNQLKAGWPDLPESKLIQAELSIKLKDKNAAIVSLTELRIHPSATAWMFEEADLIEGKLP